MKITKSEPALTCPDLRAKSISAKRAQLRTERSRAQRSRTRLRGTSHAVNHSLWLGSTDNFWNMSENVCLCLVWDRSITLSQIFKYRISILTQWHYSLISNLSNIFISRSNFLKNDMFTKYGMKITKKKLRISLVRTFKTSIPITLSSKLR